MEIHNKRDLEIAYEIMIDLKELIDKYCKEMKPEMVGKAHDHLREIKKEIRKYNNRVPDNRWIVQDDGMDGYVELIEMPETDDPEEWFDCNIRLTYAQSMYDCTGQAFTFGHKIFRRRGKLMCYHDVCFDL